MIRMPCFEEYYNMSSHSLNVYWKLINNLNLLLPTDKVDFIGKRVSCYQMMLRECDVVSHGIIKFFTGYNLSEDKIKRWKCQSAEYINAKRDSVTKRFRSVKSTHLQPFKKFQSGVVNFMNPKSMQS